MATARKKKNIFVRYFTPFGLRQVCDLIMLAGFVLLIVGLCTVDGVLLAGFICYAVGAGLSIARCCLVLFSKKINHRDPAYKSAIINVSIMGVLFTLAVFGLVWTIVA
ncbi:MAG: hypothetical protein K2L54_00800 [Clostridiales bacterium]|nr:hypothetical protein [Clostridiales bacterium]